MKPQVRWTQREWRVIAAYFRDNALDPLARGFSGSLREAMKALPEERRRPTVGRVPKTKHVLALAIQNLPAKEEQLAAPTSAPQAPTAQELSTEDLLVELARRIARILEPKTPAAAPAVPTPHHKHNPEPVSEERQRKPRIMVCGPNSDLASHLKQEFPNLDLRFIGFQDNPALVASRAQSCDTILVLTKFVNHSTAEAVKHSCVPFRLVTGAKEARAWLSTL